VLVAAWCYARGHEVSRWWWADRGRAARREQMRLAAAGQIEAGKRTVNIPSHVLPVLAAHMETWAGADRVFVGRDGRPMRGDAVRQAFNRARLKAGMPGFRFHDLRHTGQTLAASAGATTKDLMLRLGHAPRPLPIATCTPWMAAMPRSRRPCPILLLMAMRTGSLNPSSSSTDTAAAGAG
jgi:hypothetical protein